MKLEIRALTPQEMKDWLSAHKAPKQWLKELIGMTTPEEVTKCSHCQS
jgi:hypothetical protein